MSTSESYGKQMFTRSNPGSNWTIKQMSDEDFPTRFLLSFFRNTLTDERRSRMNALLTALGGRGWHLIEADRQVENIPAGVAILHDGDERALVTVHGDGIAELVGDILDGNGEADEFIARVEDVLASSPPRSPKHQVDKAQSRD